MTHPHPHPHPHPHDPNDDLPVDDPAPEPHREPDPEPEPHREPEPPAPTGRSTEARLDALETLGAQLMDVVASLAPKDEKPVKVPWTHRGSAPRGGDDE